MNRARVVNFEQHRMESVEPKAEGYLKIPNNLFDAVLSFKFTLKQQSVLLAVIRKTLGYNKRIDDVSAAQIGALCGMSRHHVTETLNELERMRVITKRRGEYGCVVGVNCDSSAWMPPFEKSKKIVPNQDDSPESGLEIVPNRDGSIVPNQDTQKTTFQKTTSKDKESIARSADHATQSAQQTAFAQFWDAFAYKNGRKRAEAAFAKQWKLHSAEPGWLDALLNAAKTEAARRDAMKAAGRTPMYAEGWLSQERYTDEDLQHWGDFTAEQQAFIDCYNANIGDAAPQCSEWTERRAALIDIALRGRWKAEQWAEFWRWVAQHCEFRWPVSIDWLLQRDNFAAVREGKYERGGQ